MISKELLSDVLDYEVYTVGVIDHQNNLWYGLPDGDKETINIHELAHKCKEWAWTHNYSVGSWKYVNGYQGQIALMGKMRAFNESSEPEAIFKACEWILNQKEQR